MNYNELNLFGTGSQSRSQAQEHQFFQTRYADCSKFLNHFHRFLSWVILGLGYGMPLLDFHTIFTHTRKTRLQFLRRKTKNIIKKTPPNRLKLHQ